MNNTNKHDRFDYFRAYEEQVGYAKELVLNLGSAIESGELGSRDLMRALHVVENDADEVNHQIQARLLSDFVVPMERGCMAELAHALDDLCDAVEQIAIDSYTRRAETLDPTRPFGIKELVSLLESGTLQLASAVGLLSGLDRKRDEIKRFCVEAQGCESKADEVYIESVRALYERADIDDRSLRVMHDLLDAVEGAADTMEFAAEMVERIVAESV